MDFQNGQQHVMIARGDLGIGWIWQNAEPWLETPMDWQMVSGDVDLWSALAWQEAGQFDIDGETCLCFKGFGAGSCEKPQEECFVLPSGIRRRVITYRTDGGVGIIVDCVDLKLGPPPLSIFELPPDARVQRLGG
ncbi:MAG: hypothetical protein JWM57_3377 [Phycisphaerales bacterium]|nr:hypothetical protein [Phycisphaerales bacterium]